MNNQTPGPLEASNGLIWPPTMDAPVGGITREVFDHYQQLTPQQEANTALLAAAYTAFDKAGRELGIDAAELARTLDIAAVFQVLADLGEYQALQSIDSAEVPVFARAAAIANAIRDARDRSSNDSRPN